MKNSTETKKWSFIVISDQIYNEEEMASVIVSVLGDGIIYANDVCFDLCKKYRPEVEPLQEDRGPIPALCLLWYDGKNDKHILPYMCAFPSVVMNYTSGQYKYNDILCALQKRAKNES